jgi:hypothetical protein
MNSTNAELVIIHALCPGPPPGTFDAAWPSVARAVLLK